MNMWTIRPPRRWAWTGLLTVVSCAAATILVVPGLRDQVDVTSAPARPRQSVPSEQEAVAAARRTGQPVEAVSGRTERTTLYANPDGSFTKEQHLEPIRTLRNGRWVSVDATLVRYSNGRIGPKAATMAVSFSPGGDAPLATVSRMGRSFSLWWQGALPEPTIDGRRATYADVLPDVDLVVNVDVTGFSHVLVVKTPRAAKHPRLSEITLRLKADRVKVKVQDGRLVVADAGSGGTMFVAPRPMMWDSGTGAAAGEEPEPTKFAPETARSAPLEVDLSGDTLRLIPDAAFLSDSHVRYPIYIDPVWGPEKHNTNWAMVDSGYEDMEYWNWANSGNTESQRVGLCPSDCGRNSKIKRIFFQIPTDSYIDNSMEILQADFHITVRHVENTSDAYGTQLWLTGGISPATNWSNQPAWLSHLSTAISEGTQACGQTTRNIVLDATSAVQQANVNDWTITTFGLKSNREDLTSAMRRFCHDAFISVRYNKKPAAPTSLSADSGIKACRTGATDRQYANQPPTLSAWLSDPDSATELLSAEFTVTWTPVGGTSQTKVYETGTKYGGQYTYDLKSPTNGVPTLPGNTVISWKVRASDGTVNGVKSWGPFSGSCEFVIDTARPAGPDVDSAQYLPHDAADDGDESRWSTCAPNDGARDGVGNYGTFTFKSRTADSDVIRYWYGFEGPGLNLTYTSVKASTTVTHNPATVRFMPKAEGLHKIHVRAVDGVGDSPTEIVCDFWVDRGRDPVAGFALTDPAGATQAANQYEAANPAAAGTGVQFAAEGPDGVLGGAVRLDGTANGYLATSSLGRLDTSKPYAVSAWVKLDDDTRSQAVLSQDGTGEPGFTLYFDADDKRWTFYAPSWDAEGANAGGRAVKATSAAVLDKWTHLVAGFDPYTDKIWLQVDNGTVALASHTSRWASHGNIQIGRRTSKIGYIHHFNGAVSSVRLFDRWASAGEAGYVRRFGRTGYWPLDELTNGQTRGYSADGVTVEPAKALNAAGDTALRVPPAPCLEGPECPPADPTELMGNQNPYFDLDGDGDYLSSDAHLVGLRGSFTVAVRARLAAYCGATEQVVLSQPGANRSRFTVSCLNHRWRASFASADDTGTGGITVESEAGAAMPESDSGIGQHVALTYSYDLGEVVLYVNGQFVGTSKAANVPPWPGAIDGGFRVGCARNGTACASFFSGDIDEIRVYSGALTQNEIQLIASTTVVKDK